MKHKLIIGIHGKLGSGKGTVSNYIAEYFNNLGIPIYYRMFALPLKQVVEILSGIKMETKTDNFFEDGITDYTQKQKEIFVPHFNMTIGQMLQKVGTDVFRDHFDKNTWVKTLFEVNYTQTKNNSVYLISDARFPNEADEVKKRSGILLSVNGKQHIDSTRNINHISETAMDDYNNYDYVINNLESIESLKNKVFCKEFEDLIASNFLA